MNAVYLNLLAATTPDSLACALPASAIGGGLTSRILFILPTRDRKKFAEPPIPDRELVKALIHDLEIISRLAGVYRFSESCREKWIDWYNKYDGESIYRICKDRSFSSWYSRKSVFIQKLSVILLASRSNEMVIEWDIVEEAIAMLEGVERTMANAFVAVGRSDFAVDVNSLCDVVVKYGKINEKQLMHLMYRDMDANKFDIVVETAIRCGRIEKNIIDGKVIYTNV